MKNNKILIIEDEVSIADLLKYKLEKEGFVVEAVYTGTDGIKALKRFVPSLLLLDLMLPDINGLDICKTATVEYNIPIIMITAKTDVIDKVLGLESGADDYITKPFDFREVIARIKSTLRRMYPENTPEKNSKEILFQDIVIDNDGRIVYKNGDETALTPKEYDLLVFLCKNEGRVFTREYLLDVIWGYEFAGDTRTVDVHVRRIRKKLELDKELTTVFGVGYRLNRRR
ncbi:MAG: response regulator [Christensenellales bacterium]